MAINDKLNLTSPKQAAKEINDYAKQVKKDVEKASEKNKIKIGSLTVTYDATELNKKRLEAEAELQKNHDIGKEKLNNKFKLFYTPKGSDKKEITKSKKSLMGSTKLEGEYKTKYDEYSQNVKGDPKQKATSKEVMGIMRYAQHAENLMGVAASEVTDATGLADLEKKLDALIDIYKIYHKIKELEKTGRKFGGALEDDRIKQIHSFVQNNFMNEAEKVVGKGNIKGSINRGTLEIINNSDNPYIQRMGEQARAKKEEIDKEAKALETYYKTKALTAMQEDQASRKELANQNVAYSNAEIEKLEKQLKERQLQMKKSLQDSYDRYKQEGTNKNKESLARDYYKYTNTGAVLDDMPEIQSFFESIKGETNKDKVHSMLGSTSDIDNKMQEWLNATNTNYKAYTEIVNKMDEVKAMRDEATKTLVGIDAEEHGMDSMLVTLSKEVEEYKELAKSLETQLAATKEMSKNLVSQEEVTELKERLEFVNALVKEQEKELSKYEEIKNRVVNGGFGDNGTGTGNGTGKGTGTSSSNGDSKAENLNNDDTPLPKIKDLIKALDDGFSKVSNEFRENMTEIIDSLSKQIKTLFVGENTEDMLTSFKSSFTTMIESLNREFSKIGDKLNINTSPIEGEVSEMQQLLEVLNKISEKVELISTKDFQISADFSNLENVAELLDTIKSRLGEVKSNIKEVENSADTVEEAKPTATTANLEAAKAQVVEYENKVAEARAEYEEFKASMSGKVNLDENAVKEHLDEIKAQMKELSQQKFSINVEEIEKQISILDRFEEELEELYSQIRKFGKFDEYMEEEFQELISNVQTQFSNIEEFSEKLGNQLYNYDDNSPEDRIQNVIEALQEQRAEIEKTKDSADFKEATMVNNQIKILEARERNLKDHLSELSNEELKNLTAKKAKLEQNLKVKEKELEKSREIVAAVEKEVSADKGNGKSNPPVGIPVEPSVDAAEFAKKVTEEIANTSADIDVKPTLSNPAEFASEVAKQLNGHHVNIEVGTKIGEGSKAAEVAENLAKAEKKAGVETEETTQKVKEQKKEVEKKTITTTPTKTTTSTKTTLPTKPLKNENTDIEKKISEKIAQLEKEKEKRDRLKAEEKKIRDKFEGKNDSDTYKNVKKKIEEEKVDPWLKANELYQKYQREGDAQAYNAAACYYGFHIQDAKKKGEKPNPFMTLDGKNISNQLILRRNKSAEAYTYWEKSTEKQQNEEKQKLQKAANEATAQEDYVKQLEKELKQLQQEVKQLEKEKKSAKITNSSKNTNSNKKAKKSKGMTTEELIAGVFGGSSEKQTTTTPSSTKQQEISGVDENYVKKLKEVISLNNKLSNVDKRTKVGKGLKAQIEEVYAEYPKWKEFAKELQKLKVDDKGKFVNPDDIENFKKLAVEIAKADGAYKEFVKDQKEASEGSPTAPKKSKSSKKNTKNTEEPDNSTPDNNKDLNPNEGQEKADMLTLEEAVEKVKKAVDDKTKAFQREESIVSSVVSDEVGSLDKLKQAISEIATQVSSLKRMIDTLPPIDLKVNEEMDLGVLETTLVNIAARIEEVSSINPHFGNKADLEELSKQLKGIKLDDATTTALSELDAQIREVDTKKVSTLVAQLERIGKNTTLSENIQKIANAFLNLKTNLNNISPSATDFLNTIKEIGNLGKNLENIVKVMNASKEQIAKAKNAAGSKKSDEKSSKVNDGNDAEYKALEKSSEEYKKVIARNKEALKAIGNTYDVFRTTRRDEETGEKYISYNVKGENGSGIIGKNGTLLLDKAQVSDDYSKQKSDVKDLIKLYKEYLELLKKIHSYEYQDRNGKKEDPEKRAKYESNVEKINELNQSIRDFESRIEKGEITLNEKQKKDLHDARTNVEREKSIKENTIQKEQVRNENARQEQETEKWKNQGKKNAEQENFYKEQAAKLRAEGEEQQRKFNSDLDEVNNTLMNEYKASYENQQERWKNFQKEEQKYTSRNSKEEFKLEQDSEYGKLKDLVSRYTTVATRAADPKKALEGDALEAEELLENIYQQEQKIHDLPIMDESKTRAALKPLGELENKLKDIAATVEKREAGSNKIVSTVSANGLNDSQKNLERQVNIQNQIYETQRKINLADEEEKPSLKYKLDQLKEQKAKLEEILLTTSEFKNLDDAKKSELLAEYNKKIDVRTKTSKDKMEISQNEDYKAKINSNNDDLLNISKSKINQGIDVSNLYEEASNSLDKYNKQLLEGKVTLATYEKNVAKLKSQLKEVIAVVDTASEGQAQDAIMKDLQAKTGGNYKITDSKKGQIVAQFSEGKGVVKDLIYQYDQFTGAITRVENAHSKLQGMGKFWSEMGSKFRDVGKYFLSFVSIYDVWRVFRNGVEYVKEMDTAMTELTKVSNDSKDALEAFKNESYEIAEQVGSTGTTVVESAANWERLGESLEQAKESAKASTILFNVSEFESIDAATESLVSMSQAYKDLDKMEIVDKMNNIGNNYSIATDELATGLQDAAAVLQTQGNNLDEAIALITAGNAITQDASKTAGGVRTISLRIAGTEEAGKTLEAEGEDVSDYVVMTSAKKQQIIKDYTAVASNNYQGVNILDDNGNLKNTYNILLEISKVYKEIQDEDKKYGTNRAQALVEELAGKNRSNIAASILQNPEMLEDVNRDSAASNGSAQEELKTQLDSIETHIEEVKNKWQQLWQQGINKAWVNGILELVKGIEGVANAIGLIPLSIASLVGIVKLKAAATRTIRKQEQALNEEMARQSEQTTLQVAAANDRETESLEREAAAARVATEASREHAEADRLEGDAHVESAEKIGAKVAETEMENASERENTVQEMENATASEMAATANLSEAESLVGEEVALQQDSVSLGENTIQETQNAGASSAAATANEVETGSLVAENGMNTASNVGGLLLTGADVNRNLSNTTNVGRDNTSNTTSNTRGGIFSSIRTNVDKTMEGVEKRFTDGANKIKDKAVSIGQSILGFVKTPVGLITTVIGVGYAAFTAYSKWQKKKQEEIQKAYEDAANKMKSLNEQMQAKSQLITEKGSRYAELAQRVDLNTNKNIDLSDGDYKEFLEISNELAELFPSLKNGIDEEGNAILNLNGSAETINNSLRETLELEEALNKKNLLKSAEDKINNSSVGLEEAQDAVDEANKNKQNADDVSEQMNTLLSGGGLTPDDYAGQNTEKKLKEALGHAGLTKKQIDKVTQISSNNKGTDLYLADSSMFDEAQLKTFRDNWNSYRDDLVETLTEKQKEKKVFSDEFSEALIAYWLPDQSMFNKLPEELQKALKDRINEVDWTEKKGFDDADDKAAFIEAYIKNNMMKDLNGLANDEEAYTEYLTALNQNKGENIKDYVNRVQGVEKNLKSKKHKVDLSYLTEDKQKTIDEYSGQVKDFVSQNKEKAAVYDLQKAFTPLTSQKSVNDLEEEYNALVKEMQTTDWNLKDNEQKVLYDNLQNRIDKKKIELQQTKEMEEEARIALENAGYTEDDFDKLAKKLKVNSQSEYESFIKAIQNSDRVFENIEKQYKEIQASVSASANDTARSIQEEITKLQASLSTVDEILSAGGTLTIDQYNDLIAANSEYANCLVATADGLKLDANASKELEEQMWNEKQAEIEVAKAQDKLDYHTLTEKLREQVEAYRDLEGASESERESCMEKIGQTSQELSSIEARIVQYELLSQQIADTTSKFTKFTEAQSAVDSGANYDTMVTATSSINDAFDTTHKFGTAEFEAAVDLMIPDKVSDEGIEAIEKYKNDVLKRYMKYDGDGNIKVDGLQNFITDSLSEENGLLTGTKDNWVVAENTKLEDFAEKLNLTKDAVVAIFGELEEYGYGTQFDFTDELIDSATDSYHALEEIEASLLAKEAELRDKDLWYKKDKDGNYKTDKDGNKVLTKEAKVVTRRENKTTKLEKKAAIKTGKELGSNLDDIVELEKRQKAYEKAQAKAKKAAKGSTEEFTKAAEEERKAGEAYEEFAKKVELPTQIDIEIGKEGINEDLENISKKIEKLEKKKEKLAKEQNIDVSKVDESKIIDEKTGQSLEQWRKVKETEEQWLKEMTNLDLGTDDDLTQLEKLQTQIDDMITDIEGAKEFEIDTTKAETKITTLSNRIATLKTQISQLGNNGNKKSIVGKIGGWVGSLFNGLYTGGTYNGHTIVKRGNGEAFANGGTVNNGGGNILVGELGTELISDRKTGTWYTVGENGAEFVNLNKGDIVFNHKQTEKLLTGKKTKARGEAFANGGVVKTGRALVGELGQEIVVDRKTGTWRTVGDNGAEFVNLNKGDVVFNHEQTEKLLNSSSTDNRGNEAYVNGTHQSGQAYVRSTTSSGLPTGDPNGGNKGNGKGNKNNKDEKDDKDDKTKTPLEKFQEWLSKFFDWIEVRLSRLETKIDSAITKAEKYVSDGNYSKAGTQYKKAINTTSSLINVNRKGATKYTSQANRVLNKAVSDGLIKDKQASGIKKKVANGSIDISEYGEKMREVISAYQEYYEKALSCSTATTELKNSMKDYYEALYNLPIDKASRKIEEFSANLEVLTSKASAISGGTKNYEEVVKADAKARYNTANNKVENATKEKETADKKVTSSKKALLSATKNKSVIKAAKANKTVDTKGLKGKALKAAKAYNKALSEQKTSNSQLKTAKAIRDDQKSQMNDLPKYEGEYYNGVNSVLQEETDNQKDQLKEYNNAKKTTDSNLVKADNNLEKKKATLLKDKGLTKAQRKAIKEGKEIDTSKLKGKALKHANAYNKALQAQVAASTAATTATQNLEKAESEFVSTKQDNAKTMLDNVSSYYDSKNALVESKISYDESNISLKKAKGETVTRNDYKGIEEDAKLIHEQASQELAAYQTQYDAVKGDLSEADNEAALQKIEELKKAEVDAYTAMKTYHQEAIQADIDNVEKELGLVGTQSETLTDERGIRDNINKQIELTNRKYELLIEQEADATKQAQLRAEQQQSIVSLLQQQIEKEEKLSNLRIDRHSADANREQTNTDVKTASGKDSVEILADNYRTQAYYSGQQEEEYRSRADKLFSEDEGGLYSSKWGTFSEDRSTFYVSEDKWNAWNEEINKAIEYYSKANQAQVDRLNNEFTAWETENITPLEDKLSENERTISKEQSTIDLNNVKGIKTTVADYQKLIGLSEEKVASLNEEKAAYMEQLKNYDVGSTKYKEIKQKIDEIDTSTASVEKETEEWKNAMVQLTFDNLDEANEKLNTMISYYESIISLMESIGRKPIDLDYMEVMKKNDEEIENKRKAAKQAKINSIIAESSENGAYGGKTSQEWMDMYYSYNTDVNNLLIKNEELKDSIINTYVRPFEEAYERYKTCYDIFGQMQSLFSSYSFDEEGNLTEYGFAELDSMVKQYDAAVKASGEAQKALDEIDEIHAQRVDGLSDDEWKEKRKGYVDEILSSASDAQSALQGIAQIQTTIMQNELDNLKELIDTRKEALQKKKEYYDYDKTIRSKTKDIQSIESQIAALKATEDGLEKRKKLLELQEQLKDAKDDLEDTTMEHQISLVTEGMDDFMEKYSEEVTKKIDALNSNLTKQLETYQETKKITTEMKDIIAGAYDTMSKSVRVDIGTIKQQADGSMKIVKGFAEGGTIGGKSWSGDKLIARVNSGETILTKDFTDLMPSAVDAMENFVKIDIPDFANILASRNPAVTISYENMINISGNANTDTVKQIESLIPKITQSVTKNIVKDLKKNGF